MDRRDFIKTVSTTVAGSTILPSALVFAAGSNSGQSRISLVPSNQIEMGGIFGKAYRMSVDRLGKDPFNTNFILADLNFNQKRWFTNFSGDISGRFLETTSLTSTKEKPVPSFLKEVMARVPDLQKADGHFGHDVDWNKAVDFTIPTTEALQMPILWGNGRLFLGLLAAWERFGDPKMLAAAEKMGDFYINIVLKRFCDPARMKEYQTESEGYASAYVTCVFHGIEGLARCYRLTGKKKYLDAACQMADFHEPFDVLPVRHSHGSVSTHEALVMLYEETGDQKYLDRVEKRWETAVGEGYINACGSILEKYWITGYNRDEGCTESDWLRLNLMLWRNTGKARYLDFAERLLWNGYLANQWPTGGYGHRYVGIDEKGPFSWQKPSQESLWCCSFHCPLGLYEFKEYLAVFDGKTLLYNFPIDFKTPFDLNGKKWTVVSRSLDPGEGSPLRTEVRVNGPAGESIPFSIRVPDWADCVEIRLNGKTIVGKAENGRFLLPSPIAAGSKLELNFKGRPFLEDRRLHRLETGDSAAMYKESVLRYGPHVLVSRDTDGKKIEDLELSRKNGVIQIPSDRLSFFGEMNWEQQVKPHTFVFHIKLN
ncbi:MAG: glycoside hydrolase family 127 protein [Planctomycetia bacterium]|nr:glycoside hydrolase family 127 protein [Planctomycetia bacterium]